MKKKILLARPSIFIVNNMRNLVSEIGCEAESLKRIEDLTLNKSEDLCGIVISTGVASILPHSFEEMLQSVIIKFPGTPLFFASMSDSPTVKKSIDYQLKMNGSTKSLTTIDDIPQGNKLGNDFVLLLKKSDLTDKNRYSKTLQSFRNMMIH